MFGTFVWLVWRAREPVRQRLGDMMARDMASAGANGVVSAPAAKAIATLFQNWHRIVIAYLAIAWLLWAGDRANRRIAHLAHHASLGLLPWSRWLTGFLAGRSEVSLGRLWSMPMPPP